MLVDWMRRLQPSSICDEENQINPCIVLSGNGKTCILEPIWSVKQRVDILISSIKDIVLVQRPLPSGPGPVQKKLDCLVDLLSRVHRRERNNCRVIEVSNASGRVRAGVVDSGIGDIRVIAAFVRQSSRCENFLVETTACDSDGVVSGWFVELHHDRVTTPMREGHCLGIVCEQGGVY